MVEKALILSKVLSFCPPSETYNKSIHDTGMLETRVYCPLLYESKVTLFILCMFSPLLIFIYFAFIFAFIAYFIATCFTLLILPCECESETDFECIFTWPCRLCAMERNCNPCQDHWCKFHFYVSIIFIIVFVPVIVSIYG